MNRRLTKDLEHAACVLGCGFVCCVVGLVGTTIAFAVAISINMLVTWIQNAL